MHMKFKEFASTFFIWTFFLFLSFVSGTPVEVYSKVIGSSQPVVSAVGGDVVLPCYVEPLLDAEKEKVEWWKSDFVHRYVHLYRDGRDVEDVKKLPSYVERTTLFKDELKHGNVSLKIVNVTLSDAGRYICHVPQLKSRYRTAEVYLTVDPNLVQTQMTETPLDAKNQSPGDTTNNEGGRTSRVALIVPAVVFCVLVLAAGVRYYFIRRHQNQDHEKYEAAQTEAPPL